MGSVATDRCPCKAKLPTGFYEKCHAKLFNAITDVNSEIFYCDGCYLIITELRLLTGINMGNISMTSLRRMQKVK